MQSSRSVLLVLMPFLLLACGGEETARPESRTTETSGATIDVAGAPESFYAVRDEGTDIVEVETATGRILRTVVDIGPAHKPLSEGGDHTFVSAIDLAPDGQTLWYSAGTSVFRIALPQGTPEEIAAGHDPSVSPNGRRLAWIEMVPGDYDPRFRIRDLDDGTEQTLHTPDALSLEGYNTTWSADATKLAFSTGGVESFWVATVEIATGRPIYPEPAEEIPGVAYTPYAPRYRPSDGLLVVACCGEIPDPPPDLVPPPSAFVLHDPETGAERERIHLSIDPRAHDYDRSGAHHLVSTIEGDVYLDRNGERIRIPEITGVSELAW